MLSILHAPTYFLLFYYSIHVFTYSKGKMHRLKAMSKKVRLSLYVEITMIMYSTVKINNTRTKKKRVLKKKKIITRILYSEIPNIGYSFL
jgi:hypothetical protein